jgi:hypothetical protein
MLMGLRRQLLGILRGGEALERQGQVGEEVERRPDGSLLALFCNRYISPFDLSASDSVYEYPLNAMSRERTNSEEH